MSHKQNTPKKYQQPEQGWCLKFHPIGERFLKLNAKNLSTYNIVHATTFTNKIAAQLLQMALENKYSLKLFLTYYILA